MEAEDVSGEVANLSVAEILNSDDFNLQNKVAAYTQILSELQSLGDTSLIKSFKVEYSGFEVFANMSDNVLSFIDNIGLTTDEINKL
jgi:hypothetical protein